MTPEDIDRFTVRGRYGPGLIDGEPVVGYLDEPRVAEDSVTETYAALRLHIDNWRWACVPFYIRAGKRLARRVTEVVISFKPPPHMVFEGQAHHIEENTIVLRIQPDEGVRLSFQAKRPGPGLEIDQVPMNFRYAQSFKHEPPEAYERLLLDAFEGDASLFARADEVEAAWQICDPILDAWQSRDRPTLFMSVSSDTAVGTPA